MGGFKETLKRVGTGAGARSRNLHRPHGADRRGDQRVILLQPSAPGIVAEKFKRAAIDLDAKPAEKNSDRAAGSPSQKIVDICAQRRRRCQPTEAAYRRIGALVSLFFDDDRFAVVAITPQALLDDTNRLRAGFGQMLVGDVADALLEHFKIALVERPGEFFSSVVDHFNDLPTGVAPHRNFVTERTAREPNRFGIDHCRHEIIVSLCAIRTV